jgi:PAS domain S-box-containing protein
LLQGNLPSYSINENLTKSGETILCEWNNSILYDKNDRVDGVISLALDITERKRAEQKLMESEEKFRLAFENATDAIIWAHPETGIIVNCNKATEVLLEKKRSDIIGQHQRIIHPAEKAQYYEEVFRRHFEQKSTTDEEGEIITSTGRIIPVHITAAVTLVGNTPIIQGIFRDITHRKQAEEAIQKSTEEMKQLAYFVSHDLKNPAIAVHGLTKRFCNLYENMFDEKAKMYCSQILMSAEQIEALVQNINTYMSTKENPLHIETINLKDLIRIIKDEFNIQLNTHHVKLLEPGYAPEFRADRLSIIRVLRNLVDNAIKYGGENLSTIEIGYTDSPQFHIISVKDDGIGVAAKDSATIFGIFKQIKKRQAVAGTGLGLAIVKEIAERHKGKVWLESGELKKGVTFYMSISKSL